MALPGVLFLFLSDESKPPRLPNPLPPGVVVSELPPPAPLTALEDVAETGVKVDEDAIEVPLELNPEAARAGEAIEVGGTRGL